MNLIADSLGPVLERLCTIEEMLAEQVAKFKADKAEAAAKADADSRAAAEAANAPAVDTPVEAPAEG
jgi:hypothetical protein